MLKRIKIPRHGMRTRTVDWFLCKIYPPAMPVMQEQNQASSMSRKR